jgi:hypothetical protein
MASGKQLVDAITKLLSAGKTAEARAAVEADRLAKAPVRPPERPPEDLMATERAALKREAEAESRRQNFPTARVQDLAREVAKQERKAVPKRESRADPNELLERLLNVKSVGGEQLDLPLQPPGSGPKKLRPGQEAFRRDARLAELEEATDDVGGAIKGKRAEDINTAFERLMRERNVSADELQLPKKGVKIEEEYTELDRPQVFRDVEQQEQIIRQSGGAKGVYEDPIDEIRLDDAMRREEHLARKAGFPVESPTKVTPVPRGDKIEYNPKTQRIKGTPRAAHKPAISLRDFFKMGVAPEALAAAARKESPLKAVAPAAMPGTFRAAGTGGRGGLPTRATTKTGDLEEQGIGAIRKTDDPVTAKDESRNIGREADQSHISAQELTMDSPRAQEQMLDLFGEKQDELLNRVREIIEKIPAAESGVLKTGKDTSVIWGPKRLRELVSIVARSKSVDELAGQLHGMRGKGTKPSDLLDETGFTPVTIDNLRATLLQAPESPQRTASLEKLNKWSKEITDKSKGRFKKRLPEAFKTKKQLDDPKPELLEEWERLIAPIDPADKVAAHAEDLRQLYRTTRGDFPPKDPSKVIRRNTDKSKRLKAIQAAGEKAKFTPPHTPLGPPLDQSMIDMLRELLGQ